VPLYTVNAIIIACGLGRSKCNSAERTLHVYVHVPIVYSTCQLVCIYGQENHQELSWSIYIGFLSGIIWKLQFLRDSGLFTGWVIHGDIILIVILVLSGRFSIPGFCSPLLPKEPLVSLSPFHLNRHFLRCIIYCSNVQCPTSIKKENILMVETILPKV